MTFFCDFFSNLPLDSTNTKLIQEIRQSDEYNDRSSLPGGEVLRVAMAFCGRFTGSRDMLGRFTGNEMFRSFYWVTGNFFRCLKVF